MSRRRLKKTFNAFVRTLGESRRLAADAYSWALPQKNGRRAIISAKRRDLMTEHAFLHSFLAWENFLEESFVLYLAGHKPPRGRGPDRYAFPPSLEVATEWVVPEGRSYATWTTAAHVANRAERFFRGGWLYSPVLRSNQNTLEESRIMRNAIAHSSASVRLKFEKLVREKLGVLPPRVTVGAFLWMSVPRSTPPISFMEYYVEKIEFAAKQLVPS
jgi:hypothetical protein